MSGIEGIAGLILGVVPLIVLTFDGYVRIRELASDFANLDRKLNSIRRDIMATEGLFKSEVNAILSDIVEEDRRKIMLGDIKDSHVRAHWEDSTGTLGCEIHACLGDLYMPVLNLIQSANEILESIKEILQKLDKASGKRREFKSPEKGFRGILTMRMFDLSLGSVKASSHPSRVEDLSISSTSSKLKILGKDTYTDLKRFLCELRDLNKEIAQARALHNRLPTASVARPARVTRASSRCTANAACRTRVQIFDPKPIQMASRRLYAILVEALACRCHMLHLRLERLPKEDSIISPPSFSANSIPDIKFTFLMTTGDHNGQTSKSMLECPLHLIFTSGDFQATEKLPRMPLTPPPEKRQLCEEVLAGLEGYERFLADKVNGNAGFLLKCACSPNSSPDKSSDINISLRELVKSHAQQLTQYDKLRIAANLAHSVLSFYSSPWIRDWSLKKIRFFKGYEKSKTPALWTPHVAVSFCSDEEQKFCGMKNREIYALGLMLLEIGRSKQLEDSRGDEDAALSAALRDLVRNMGREYKEVVQDCLQVGGNAGVDLMTEESLYAFLANISLFEELAKEYES